MIKNPFKFSFLILFFIINPIEAEKYTCVVEYETGRSDFSFEKIVEITRNKDIFNAKITSITSIASSIRDESTFPLQLVYEDDDSIDLVGPTLEQIFRIFKSEEKLLYTSIQPYLKKTKSFSSCIKLK
jgi:hypothetical protein